MGRKAIAPENKRKTLTINIESDLYKRFEKLEIKNKSKFFSWLLEEHFNLIEGGSDDFK